MMDVLKRFFSTPFRWLRRKKYQYLFHHFGNGSVIFNPLRLYNPENISIGNNTYINEMAWLSAIPLTGASSCTLSIGHNCRIGDFSHIFATESIEIKDEVLIANNVYIADNAHNYSDINIPVHRQNILQLKKVVIGYGSWLGEHVCVIGASVGNHSVIGANSVVTKDIPDYCVAVGAPARVVKRYDFDNKCWRKTDNLGNFND